MTHTPGPWHVSDQNTYTSNHPVDIIAGLALVAQCGTMANRHEEKHNARLIAAAPDMLAALQMVAEYLPLIPNPSGGHALNALIDMKMSVRAAIAKATSP